MKAIIAAAGTGGHINPAIAIANKIKQEEPDSKIIFIGTKRGLENDLVPRAGYELKHIEAYGLKKEISFKNLKQIIKTITSTKIMRKIIDEFKPDVVIGTGGYICGPVFAAANSKKIPTFLHESNAYPGKAVRMFAKKADTVLVGFEEAKSMLPQGTRVVTTGNPTKVKKQELSKQSRKEILDSFGLKDSLPVILITGGSQGAQKINEAISQIIINKLNSNYQFIWATGPKQYENIKKSLEDKKIDIEKIQNAKIVPYIYNMEEVLNVMDMQICRSGAMTITELSVVGKPAIFIPLPSVGANKQEDNARVLEKLGAAKIILNSELEYNKLNNLINELIEDSEKLATMGKNAMKIAASDVENKIYKEIKQALDKTKDKM